MTSKASDKPAGKFAYPSSFKFVNSKDEVKPTATAATKEQADKDRFKARVQRILDRLP